MEHRQTPQGQLNVAALCRWHRLPRNGRTIGQNTYRAFDSACTGRSRCPATRSGHQERLPLSTMGALALAVTSSAPNRRAVDGSVLGGGDVNRYGGRGLGRCRYRASVGVASIRWGGAGLPGTASRRPAVNREQDASDPGTDAGTGEEKRPSELPPYCVCCMLNASRTAGTGW